MLTFLPASVYLFPSTLLVSHQTKSQSYVILNLPPESVPHVCGSANRRSETTNRIWLLGLGKVARAAPTPQLPGTYPAAREVDLRR